MLRSMVELKRLVGVRREAAWWREVAWVCKLWRRRWKKRHKSNDVGAGECSKLPGSERRAAEE
jgi:hypothetical protein